MKDTRFSVLPIIKKIVKKNKWEITRNIVVAHRFISHRTKYRLLDIKIGDNTKRIQLDMLSWTQEPIIKVGINSEWLECAYSLWKSNWNEKQVEKDIEKWLKGE